MSDEKIDHAALIAEARRQVKGVFKDDGYGYLVPARDIADVNAMLGRLADALEAAQQAPAVDREALAQLLDPWAWEYGNPESPAVQMSRSVALAKADATIKSGVASGVLLDATEVEARGLEKAADALCPASVTVGPYSMAANELRARARQVREGN